jgi:protein-tyrosine-phosphatase
MQIIAELEQTARGPYGGCVGYFSFNGNLDCCITIRTALLKDGRAYVQAGGGWVNDSTPEGEFQETVNKSLAMRKAVAMAEGFAKKYGLRAASAGTIPASEVNPAVVQAMEEKGIDLSSKTPKMLTSDMINEASLVITMGCSVEEVCPRPMLAKMQKKLVDWDLPDPKGKSIADVRKISDEIEKRIMELSKSR